MEKLDRGCRPNATPSCGNNASSDPNGAQQTCLLRCSLGGKDGIELLLCCCYPGLVSGDWPSREISWSSRGSIGKRRANASDRKTCKTEHTTDLYASRERYSDGALSYRVLLKPYSLALLSHRWILASGGSNGTTNPPCIRRPPLQTQRRLRWLLQASSSCRTLEKLALMREIQLPGPDRPSLRQFPAPSRSVVTLSMSMFSSLAARKSINEECNKPQRTPRDSGRVKTAAGGLDQ